MAARLSEITETDFGFKKGKSSGKTIVLNRTVRTSSPLIGLEVRMQRPICSTRGASADGGRLAGTAAAVAPAAGAAKWAGSSKWAQPAVMTVSTVSSVPAQKTIPSHPSERICRQLGWKHVFSYYCPP